METRDRSLRKGKDQQTETGFLHQMQQLAQQAYRAQINSEVTRLGDAQGLLSRDGIAFGQLDKSLEGHAVNNLTRRGVEVDRKQLHLTKTQVLLPFWSSLYQQLADRVTQLRCEIKQLSHRLQVCERDLAEQLILGANAVGP